MYIANISSYLTKSESRKEDSIRPMEHKAVKTRSLVGH